MSYSYINGFVSTSSTNQWKSFCKFRKHFEFDTLFKNNSAVGFKHVRWGRHLCWSACILLILVIIMMCETAILIVKFPLVHFQQIFILYHLQVYFRQIKLNFRLLQLNFRLLQLNFRLLQLNFRLLQLNFRLLQLNFSLMQYNFRQVKFDFSKWNLISESLSTNNFSKTKLNVSFLNIL